MSRVQGIREQRVQFYYDTDFLAKGDTTSSSTDKAEATKHLFAQARPGNPARTNMPTGGFLTGDQSFMCFAVRHEVNFYGGVSDLGTVDAGLRTTAAISIWTIILSTFDLKIDAKSMFEGPIGMTPHGGGAWGFVSDSAQPLITNGEPQTKAIYVLPLPIAITRRQGIAVIEQKTEITGMPIVDLINDYDGVKVLRCYLDGFNTRNVQ